MRLINYDFNGYSYASHHPEIQELNDLSGSNLQEWKAAMSWSKINDLDLENFDPIFFALMDGELPGLHSLRLGPLAPYSIPGDDTTKFLTRLNPLSPLSLHGHLGQANLTKIVDRHGGDLRTLEIRESEDRHASRPALSLQDLEMVNEKCPTLSKLSIDLKWNGTRPSDMFDILAAYKNLSSLEIFLESKRLTSWPQEFDEDRKSYHDGTLISEKSALRLHEHLRALKQGRDLQHLQLRVRVVGQVDADMGPLDWHHGAEWSTRTYECDIVENKAQKKQEGVAWCTVVPFKISIFVHKSRDGSLWMVGPDDTAKRIFDI